MDNLEGNRAAHAAAVFSALPDSLVALVSAYLSDSAASHLSAQLLDQPTLSEKQLRPVLRAFALDLQSLSGAQLSSFSRRQIVQLCRFHPVQTASLLEAWLEPSPTPAPAETPAQPQPLDLAERVAGLDWGACGLSGAEAGAILMKSLDDDAIPKLANQLKAEVLSEMCLALCEMPAFDARQREGVLKYFELHFGPWSELAAREPGPAAACLARLMSDVPPWQRHLVPGWTRCPLSGCSMVAILMETIEADWKETFLESLPPAEAEHIRVAASVLCPASESLKNQLLNDFSSYFGAIDELLKKPETVQACLSRIAKKPPIAIPPPSSTATGKGLRVLHGDLLRDSFREGGAARSQLAAQRGELQAAWNRVPAEYDFQSMDQLGPFEVEIQYRGQGLQRFQLRPEQETEWIRGKSPKEYPTPAEIEELRRESGLQLMLRKFGSVQAQIAAELPLTKCEAEPLPPEYLPAIAALRSYPANLLEDCLRDLENPQLGRLAESLTRLFATPPEQLTECIRNSCLVSPTELMDQAGLERSRTRPGSGRMARMAILLALAPGAAEIARALLVSLSRPMALRLVEAMMRLFYRWEERRLESQEYHPILADFLSWHGRPVSCPREAPPSAVADSIVRLWPFWSEAAALHEFKEKLCAYPTQAAREFREYLLSGPEPAAWVPGPILAAQFLHGLNESESVRRELNWRHYPLPCLPVDLALLERAQQEWNRASRTGSIQS